MSGLTIEQALQARLKSKEEINSSEIETEVQDSEEQLETTDEIVEENEAVKETVETPEEDIVEEEVEETESEEDDIEESEESEQDTDSHDELEEELEVYDFGEFEASLEDIKEWKEGSLRQSDYTKKTQALSEEKKAFEAEKESVSAQLEKIKEQAAMLEVLIEEENLTDEEWAELREYDPSEYLEKKEKQDKRKSALEAIKAKNSTPQYSQEYIQAEQAKIFEANPDWLTKDGKLSEKATKDLKMVNDYLDTIGYSPEKRQNMVSAAEWRMVLDAAKNVSKSEKTEVIKKKLKKAPTVTKSRGKTPTLSRGEQELRSARKAAKENPSIENMANLRAIERKYKK